jgi:mannose-1-phosphate guanylyltransferase/phosphomannomutase
MRAILLSAGRGERLKPLTDTIPKVMLAIDNKPLLQYWIEKLRECGVTEIAINLHWLGDKIKDYFGNGNNFGVNIKYSEEETLLGTASPIRRIEKIYPGFCSEENFFVIYADNLTDMDLTKVIEFHKNKKSPIATITLHAHEEPWTRGIVNTDMSGKVIEFVEKPPKEEILSGKYRGESASCVMLFEPKILEFLREEKEDLGTDVFPRLLENNCDVYAFNPRAIVEDIGTPERYEKAKKVVAEFPKKFNS